MQGLSSELDNIYMSRQSQELTILPDSRNQIYGFPLKPFLFVILLLCFKYKQQSLITGSFFKKQLTVTIIKYFPESKILNSPINHIFFQLLMEGRRGVISEVGTLTSKGNLCRWHRTSELDSPRLHSYRRADTEPWEMGTDKQRRHTHW